MDHERTTGDFMEHVGTGLYEIFGTTRPDEQMLVSLLQRYIRSSRLDTIQIRVAVLALSWWLGLLGLWYVIRYTL